MKGVFMYKNYRWIFKNSLPTFGGRYGNSAYAGTFSLSVDGSAADSSASIGGRLMFL